MAQGSSEGISSSSSISWMMAAVVGAMLVLFGAGIVVTSRVFSSMVNPPGGNTLTMHTPRADLRVEKPNETGPGLPLYPRAVLLVLGANFGQAMPRAKHAQSQMTTYYTEDVPPLVESWYLQHLSAEFARHTIGESQGPAELDEIPAPVDSVAFLGMRGDQVRMVTLTSASTGTRITLVRFANPPAEPAQ